MTVKELQQALTILRAYVPNAYVGMHHDSISVEAVELKALNPIDIEMLTALGWKSYANGWWY